MKHSLLKVLLSTSVLATSGLIPARLSAQSDIDACGSVENGQVRPDCVQANAGDLVTVPAGANTEPEVSPVTNNSGFSISVDGDAIDSDPTIEDKVRKIDLRLEEANVQVTFDGLTPQTRLGVETVGASRAYRAGDPVTLQSETNYPAFIARGEFRIIDRRAIGGEKLLAVVPVDANGQASFALPAGNDVVVVHRVYGAQGRFDETAALPLGRADDRGLRDDVEELDDGATVKNIKVVGGAVTVYADNLTPGSSISALGSTARPDPSGAVVMQRILPPGQHDVSVRINGGQGATITRPIDVPRSEWFRVAVIDLTVEHVRQGDDSDTRTLGRFQYYVDGRTANGYEITSSVDTGEEELRDIFRRFDEKDPRSVLERIDPEDTYPTFGDDSEIYDNTPTSGKFYLRVEKNRNSFLWGDYQSGVTGNTFIRNERTLYGAQVKLESKQATANGDPLVSAEFYAAQPDQLAGRETFQGTGGSVYFLRRQDISQGTETVLVEVRDAVTGLVVNQKRLVLGRDYQVNYLQGVVTLNSPLTDSINNNLIQTNPGGDQVVNLVVQYEYTPISTDVDGFSVGGRVETWASDQLRLGLTATRDDTGTVDHKTVGADVRFQFAENSFVQFDAARSDGPGLVQDFSIDGGLTIDGRAQPAGEGSAYRLAGQADLRDLGYDRTGVVGGYIERRDEGFSSLDYSVTVATGDELFYGAYARAAKTDTQVGWAFYADVYENDAGVERNEIGVELEGDINARLSYVIAAEYLDQRTATTDGSRLDLAARLNWVVNENLSYYAFGQLAATTDNLEKFNRVGLGFSRALTDRWRVDGEISGGDGGTGARLLAEYKDDNGNSSYFGYELDAGRSLDLGGRYGSNRGEFLVGGRSQINDAFSVFGENRYDIFSARKTLTSAYGLEYQATEFMAYDAALEFGQVAGTTADELDRFALSFGMRYQSENMTGRARLEFRRDDAAPTSTFNDFDAIYFSSNMRYKIDEEQRLVFSLDAADSQSDGTSVTDGSIVDLEFGYAYRPIWNERLNMLARYRYLRDMFGQEIDGVAGSGARQTSHVFSLEGSYDLSRSWTLGGKVGGRITESSAAAGDPFIDNNAMLAIINARYHLVHDWDVLIEARHLDLSDAGLSETSFLGAAYKHLGNNVKLGVGYNFGSFSDDLTDLSRDDRGAFINIVAKF